MPTIKIETVINSPVERVFDLSRCIDLHEETMSKHKEKAIAGVTEGLIGYGESVTWEATHFMIRQTLSTKITGYDRPHYFQDAMIEGAFKKFAHDHFFEEIESGTVMKDAFEYESPMWIFGRIADALFLEKYLENMLRERNALIKRVAESDDWKKFLPQ